MNRRPVGPAGPGSTQVVTPRKVMLVPGLKLNHNLQIDGNYSRDPLNTNNKDVLRCGMLMGMDSTSKRWKPSIIGVLTADYEGTSSTAVKMMVAPATATEIVRRVGSSGTLQLRVIGPPTAAGSVAQSNFTHSAVNTTTGAITVTDVDIDFIAGSFITVNDGTYDPKLLLTKEDGVLVRDRENDTDKIVPFPAPYVSGVVDSSQIINWPSDTSLQTWLVAKLNAAGYNQFTFDHLFQ